MKIRMKALSALSTVAVVALLTACGGGDTAATPTAPITPEPTVTNISMLAFSNTGEISTQTATLTGPGETGVLAFTDPTFTITAPYSDTPIADNKLRKIKGGGAALLYCAGGIVSNPQSSTATDVKTAYEGSRLFIAANSTLVTDIRRMITELAGKTFEGAACAGSPNSFTVNADGSALKSNGKTISAANLLAYFSANGIVDGSNVYKANLYTISIGGTTRYYIAESNNEPNYYGGVQYMNFYYNIAVDTSVTTDLFSLDQTKLNPANAEIDYSWYSHVSSMLNKNEESYIVVQGSNGLQSDDYQSVVADAARDASYSGPIVASKGFIYVRPVFPQPAVGEGLTNVTDYSRYPQGLYRGSLMTPNAFKYRPDVRLNKMIDALRANLIGKGYKVAEKVFLYGFSISGAFTIHYALLNPERVKAIAPGSPGFMTLPVASYAGVQTNWPVGIADVQNLTGKAFDFETFKKIPMYLFIGTNDTVDPVSGGRTDWDPDGGTFIASQVSFIHKEFGENQATRMEKSYQYYKSINIPIEFQPYPGIAHSFTSDMLNNLLSFFIAKK